MAFFENWEGRKPSPRLEKENDSGLTSMYTPGTEVLSMEGFKPIESLEDGYLEGYATDVVEHEFDNVKNSPILHGANRGLNIIITPHVGGMTWEGQQKAYEWSINKLKELK